MRSHPSRSIGLTEVEEPDPATIRPLPVLEKTLEMLTAKYKEGTTYAYICDQFKSLRQDLTVRVGSPKEAFILISMPRYNA